MLLTKKGISIIKTAMNVCFEKVSDDLLMISLTNQIESHGIPSYWRLTKTDGIPPLAIGIDCQQGFISNITFFVDGLAISETEDVTASMLDGNVMVDTSIFTRINDFHDVNQSYDVGVCNNKVVCSFETLKGGTISYRNDRVEIYVDSNNCVVGFSVCDLSEGEKCLIKSILIPPKTP